MTLRMSREAGREFIKYYLATVPERTLAESLGWPRHDLRAEVLDMRSTGELPPMAEPSAVSPSEAVPAFLAAAEGPPLKLPEGDSGWHRAADWLRHWGFDVRIDLTRVGTHVAVNGKLSNVADLCDLYREQHRKRVPG